MINSMTRSMENPPSWVEMLDRLAEDLGGRR